MGAHKVIRLNSEYKIEQLAKEIINCSESQIVIEAPENCQLLANEINLRLIKFYAEEEEKELIINAVDPKLSLLAQRLGISTPDNNQPAEMPFSEKPKGKMLESPYSGEAEVAAAPEEQPTPSLAHRNSIQGRLLPALVVVLFTLILAIWWFLQPKAVVLVYPKEQELPFRATAQISTAFNDADILKGKIPAKNLALQSEIVTVNATTGHKIIGVIPAVGKVLVINNSNQPVMLAKGSILYGRDDIRFSTDHNIFVPKKATKLESGIVVGENYGKAEVNITAEIKGTIGNQPTKAINKIEPKYQKFLRVTNPAPTRNGADKQIAIVTLEDVKKGESEIRNQMQLAVNDEARSLVNRDYVFFPELVKSEVIRITNKPEIGSEGDSVETHLIYKTRVLAPTAVGIQKFLSLQFAQSIPANFEAKNHRVELVTKHMITLDEELAGLELVGQGQVRGVLNPSKIKNLIKGKSVLAAKEALARLDEVAEVKFQMNDSRRAKLPVFGFQIKLLFPAGSRMSYRQ